MIARDGASTIFEALEAKIPTILIPLRNSANNHQYFNAKALVDNDEAIMLEEENLSTDNIKKTIENLLNDKEKFSQIPLYLIQIISIQFKILFALSIINSSNESLTLS